jgi:hypothetical protein
VLINLVRAARSISTSDEPPTVGVSQQDINEEMIRNGPPSIQELQASLNPTGSSYRVLKTSLARISYMDHQSGTRTRLLLSKDAPISRAVETAGRILGRPILGGLHRQYGRI